jgi:solute carrier family 40 (iron-regulated transporter), member 1
LDPHTGRQNTTDSPLDESVVRYVRWKLYVGHTLSTFNSRVFEFGAFLFLATIYPNSLRPASIYALSRAGSAAILSPVVGQWIDSCERLRVLQTSIAGQRLPVALSCLLLFSMARYPTHFDGEIMKASCLIALSLFACVEKLAAIMNTIAIERDWVVVIAGNDESMLSSMSTTAIVKKSTDN